MQQHEDIIRWIARLVVLIYLIRLSIDLRGWPADLAQRRRQEQVLRGLWTGAFVLHVVHVLLAFQWIHLWSHAAAYEHTAARTGAVTGWYWGGGVWINYLFTVLWLADVFWTWWKGIDQLSRGYLWFLHSIFLFLLFNATVVFGPRWWSLAAIPVGAILLIVWLTGPAFRISLQKFFHHDIAS